MGHRICIMNKGEVVQIGKPLEVYRNPANTFVATLSRQSADEPHPGHHPGRRSRLPSFVLAAYPWPANCWPAERLGRLDGKALLGIRPEDLYETSPRPGDERLVAHRRSERDRGRAPRRRDAARLVAARRFRRDDCAQWTRDEAPCRATAPRSSSTSPRPISSTPTTTQVIARSPWRERSSMGDNRIIDTHAHIIDPARFPLADGPGYKPLPHETGTSEEYCTVLDAHGVAHALLVQPSGYGYDNSALLDAMARHPGRFKAIAVVDPETPESELAKLRRARRGRRSLQPPEPQARRARRDRGPSASSRASRSLAGSRRSLRTTLNGRRSPPRCVAAGVRVLVDHFGVRNPAAGLSQPGFAAVLALGRDGNATVKLSAPVPALAPAGRLRRSRPLRGGADRGLRHRGLHLGFRLALHQLSPRLQL